VIQQLPAELRDAVCVFYLVLRALDTVEDDMALPAATKLPLLHAFHERIYDRRGAAPVNCAGPPAARQQARPRRRARRSLVPEPAGGAQDVHGRVRLRAVCGPDAPVPARDRPLPAPGHALPKGAPPCRLHDCPERPTRVGALVAAGRLVCGAVVAWVDNPPGASGSHTDEQGRLRR